MGWFFTSGTRSDLIRELIESNETERAIARVIAHALRGNVLWSVVQVTAKQEGVHQDLTPGQSICYIRCDLLTREGSSWGYKPMDESVHPFYYSCPLSYLDMAPEQSPEWRAKVREYHRRRTRRFNVGDKVEVVGCTIPWVRITDAKDLTGEYGGVRYRLSRSQMGEVLRDEQTLTEVRKVLDSGTNAVIGM